MVAMKVTKKKVYMDEQEAKPDTIKDGVLIFPTYISGIQMAKSAERHYLGWYKGYRVIACLFTKRKGESWGKGVFTYYIDKEKKEYKTVDELIEELNKRTLSVTL